MTLSQNALNLGKYVKNNRVSRADLEDELFRYIKKLMLSSRNYKNCQTEKVPTNFTPDSIQQNEISDGRPNQTDNRMIQKDKEREKEMPREKGVISAPRTNVPAQGNNAPLRDQKTVLEVKKKFEASFGKLYISFFPIYHPR